MRGGDSGPPRASIWHVQAWFLGRYHFYRPGLHPSVTIVSPQGVLLNLSFQQEGQPLGFNTQAIGGLCGQNESSANQADATNVFFIAD